MNIKIVKETTPELFESSMNNAILQLQQQGNSEFTIQYQPLYVPGLTSDFGSGGGVGMGGLSNGYVIYTALITYK